MRFPERRGQQISVFRENSGLRTSPRVCDGRIRTNGVGAFPAAIAVDAAATVKQRIGMSLASLPYAPPPPVSPALAKARSAPFLEKACLFLVGLLMPAIAVSPWGFSSRGLTRATMVDVVVMFTLLVLLLGRKLKVSGYAVFYFATLGIATVIGMAHATTAPEVQWSAINFLALTMALFYFIVGASVGRSRGLVKALVIGFIAAILWESVIVLHDAFSSSQWFPEADSRRTQGTFRNGGQLAIYGYSAAGLMFCYGWPLWKNRWVRILIFSCGGLALFFIVAGSRRSAIAALLFWLALYLAIGFRGTMKKVYPLLLAATVGVGLALASNWAAFSKTFVGSRVNNAYQQVMSGESTFQLQFWAAMDTFWQWFPVGSGLGRGNVMTGGEAAQMRGWEIHNGHLNIVVECGLLGSIAFYLMVVAALRRKWGNDFGRSTRAVRVLVLTFVISCMVFMVHNRLHRERAFMIFLGLTSALALAPLQPGPGNAPPAGQPMQRVLIARRIRKK
jgi:hypothetical protein